MITNVKGYLYVRLAQAVKRWNSAVRRGDEFEELREGAVVRELKDILNDINASSRANGTSGRKTP